MEKKMETTIYGLGFRVHGMDSGYMGILLGWVRVL